MQTGADTIKRDYMHLPGPAATRQTPVNKQHGQNKGLPMSSAYEAASYHLQLLEVYFVL
jgi:hypothetical protein